MGLARQAEVGVMWIVVARAAAQAAATAQVLAESSARRRSRVSGRNMAGQVRRARTKAGIWRSRTEVEAEAVFVGRSSRSGAEK